MTFIPQREASETLYTVVGVIAALFIFVVVVVVLVAGFGYFQGHIR